MAELTFPEFIPSAEMDRFDLKALYAQFEVKSVVLSRQLVHTTLAHLLRDCDGLEALTVLCGRFSTRSAIGPVWAEHASKTNKDHYKKVTQALFARMIHIATNAQHAALFNDIQDPELPRKELKYGQEQMTIPKAAWAIYLRLGLPEGVAAHVAAEAMEATLTSSAHPPASATTARPRL